MAFPVRRAVYRFGNFVLDPGNEALRTSDGVSIPLRPKSFSLLRLMVENSGRLLARETIMETLWPNIFVADDNITQCVQDVRRALGNDGRHMLRTIRRRGYIFEAGAVRQELGPSTQDGFHTFRSSNTAVPQGNTLSVGDSGAAAPASVGGPRSSTEKPVRLSVLVMPLKSLDASGALERLAESITGDIVTDLTKCLKNLAPGEAQLLFQDDRLAHLRAAPADCQVDYVLRGSVQGMPQTSINLQLIEASSGVCIWAERYQLYGQYNLVGRLVGDISVVLVKHVGRRIDARPTSDLTLHDLLLRGRAWLLRPTSSYNHHQALWCFERGIAVEPDSIGSRLGIAWVLVGNLANGWSHAIEQDKARAEALLLEVLQAGSDSGVMHTINGILRRLQGRLNASRVELEMTMDMAPRNAMAASQLGITLIFLGRPEAARPHLERSVRMGRHDSQAPILLNNLGLCRLLLGDTDTAIENLREAEAGNPYHFAAPLMLAAALGLKSASTEASHNLRRATRLCPALRTLSGLRNWVEKQADPDFMRIYEHMVERGLRTAGMPEA
jgi:DNA-binding winged helix-turn-helix (wHTH) protein/TolB-like protein